MFTSTKETTDKVTRIQKIRKHIKNHKRDYTIAAVSSAATVVLASVAVAIQASTNNTTAEQLIVQKNYFGKSTNCVINLTERSTPSKPVHLVGTERYFDSIHDAARKTGYTLSAISNNVNGKIPDVHGDVFEELIPV